jgi:1,2-diacylglycerol 3-alpha-glucosyltransferase
LESMAVGLPVIAAAALGIPELVQNNVNGYLVKPDDFEGMAKKTLELVGNDELLERFSSASRNLSANYSQEIITASLERIYSELIKENENLCLS